MSEQRRPPADHPHFEKAGLATRAIHAGYRPDPSTGAVNAPIYASSTFAQDGVGGLRGGFEYARTGNPTRAALETALAAVEDGRFGRAFSSGMAASDCALRAVLRPGDHIVIPDDAYGGTFRLIDKVFTGWGVKHTPVASRRPRRSSGSDHTAYPADLGGDADQSAAVDRRHRGDRRDRSSRLARTVLVDNTFASPALQQPLTLGRRHRAALDHEVHRRPLRRGRRCAGHQRRGAGRRSSPSCRTAPGAVPGPFDAYLTMRGLKTLVLRMQRHSENAAAVAEFLAGHPAMSPVLYPGLPRIPATSRGAADAAGSAAWCRSGCGGGAEAARNCAPAPEMFILAESLGGVESLIEHPGAMTHASTAGSQLEVPDDLVRLSVGIEDVADLIADLEQALG